MSQAIVWTIAGSDSGGGAGIQADSAAMRAFVTHPCTVISALTAQNSVAVTQVHATSDSMLLAQLQTLGEDLPPAAIKIGMLANAAQVLLVASYIRQHFSDVPVILDPVAVSTSGAKLADGEVLGALLKQLMPLSALITPNLPELEQLTGTRVNDQTSMVAAAEKLITSGAGAVLVKAGHADWQGDQAEDIFVSNPLRFRLTQPRQQTRHSHGTGCTLASAVAAAMAKGAPLEDAVIEANAYVAQGLSHAAQLGQGAGALAQTFTPVAPAYFARLQVDKPALMSVPERAFAPLKDPRPGLYPVVDNTDLLAQVLACGVRIAQLRIKPGAQSEANLEQEVIKAIALGQRYQAQVFINDHWQLALKHGAYGVHLGQEDLAGADLQSLEQKGIALGVSTHGYFELLRAMALKPSYIALGHVFATPTKVMKSSPQGLDKLTHYASLAKAFPTVAIGGIDLSNASEVYRCGVDSVAVVRAISEASDLPARVEAFQRVN